MTKRYFTLAQQARRRIGRLVAIYAALVIAGIAISAAQASYVDVPAVAAVVVVFLVAGLWGARRAFEARDFLEVDPLARVCTLTEKGVRGQELPLDLLAPLTVSLRTGIDWNVVALAPRPGSLAARRRRPQPRYQIHTAHRPDLALFEFRSALSARRKLESLAGAWQISAKHWGGEVRRAGELDQPLHVRLSGDADAARQVVLNPSWGITVRQLSPGAEFTFGQPSSSRFVEPVAYAALAVVPIVMLYQMGLIGPPADNADRIFQGVGGLAVGGLLVMAAVSAFQARVRPLQITRDGVTLGTRTMPFDEIEEITWVLNIDLQGNRRVIRVPGSWFAAEAGPILVHEIKRAIVMSAPFARRDGA